MVKHVRPCRTCLMLSALTTRQTKDEILSEPGYRAIEKSAAGVKPTCVKVSVFMQIYQGAPNAVPHCNHVRREINTSALSVQLTCLGTIVHLFLHQTSQTQAPIKLSCVEVHVT